MHKQHEEELLRQLEVFEARRVAMNSQVNEFGVNQRQKLVDTFDIEKKEMMDQIRELGAWLPTGRPFVDNEIVVQVVDLQIEKEEAAPPEEVVESIEEAPVDGPVEVADDPEV